MEAGDEGVDVVWDLLSICSSKPHLRKETGMKQTNACVTFRESGMKREIRCNERKQLKLGPIPAGRWVFQVTLTLRHEGTRLCNLWERAFQEREHSWYI